MKKIILCVACSLFILVSNTFAQKDKKLTDATVSKAKIESHIYFLASDELKGRDTPSPEQEIAARYLATQLKSFGVKPFAAYPNYLQPVNMKTSKPPKEVSIAYEGKDFKVVENTVLLGGDNLNTEAEAVFIDYGTNEDFDKIDVKGKIVFARGGAKDETSPQGWFYRGQDKRKKAMEKGAIALVELYNNSQLPWKFLVGYLNRESTSLDKATAQSAIPHIWLNDSESKEASFWKDSKGIKAKVTVEGATPKKFAVYNVVGYIEGSDAKMKDEYIVYSAHYDHVGIGKAVNGDSIYNGARDNAIGSVTVLSAAENIGKYPTKRSALFVLFTGEEKGLLGSNWFVDNSPLDLKKMVYCFNSDNAGYNDTSLVTIFGLPRTTAGKFITTACETYGLKAIDDPAPEQGLFDRSDNVNFAKKGIPAPTFSMGFKAFDGDVTKYYHQPADQPENVDYEYLYKFFRAYVYTCRLIANTSDKLFWTEGDKYYEAGKKLYGK
jgi:aminopeptidase YwaD